MTKLTDYCPSPEAAREFAEGGYWTEATTNEAFERNAREFPDRIAVVDDRVRLTWSEYYQRVQRLASHWELQGLTREDVIAIQLPNCTEFVIAANAAMMLGIPFCHFHSGFRRKEVQFILEFVGATTIVCPALLRNFDHLSLMKQLQPELARLKHLVVVDDASHEGAFALRAFLDDQSDTASPEALHGRRPLGNDVARVLFTSGTTGHPKAVIHTHNTVSCACKFQNRDYAVNGDSAMLVFLPVGLNWGFFCTVQAMLTGAKVVLMETFRASDALRLIERERITHFGTAPTALIGMLDALELEQADLSSLKVVTTSGTACPIELIRRWRARVPGQLVELYGMAEAGVQSCTLLGDDPEEVCGTVGRPAAEMGMRLVDSTGMDVPEGDVGEILSRGPSITIGYYNNPQMNAESFTADGWFRSGDLGSLDSRGYLSITGRRKEMIIRGGANIYPREIEEVLFKHPKILDAAVVGIPDDRVGERACACIVTRMGETLTFDDVIDFLRPEIATYKLPERMEIMQELPRTPTGKVQKGVLRDYVIACG